MFGALCMKNWNNMHTTFPFSQTIFSSNIGQLAGQSSGKALKMPGTKETQRFLSLLLWKWFYRPFGKAVVKWSPLLWLWHDPLFVKRNKSTEECVGNKANQTETVRLLDHWCFKLRREGGGRPILQHRAGSCNPRSLFLQQNHHGSFWRAQILCAVTVWLLMLIGIKYTEVNGIALAYAKRKVWPNVLNCAKRRGRCGGPV